MKMALLPFSSSLIYLDVKRVTQLSTLIWIFLFFASFFFTLYPSEGNIPVDFCFRTISGLVLLRCAMSALQREVSSFLD